MAACRQLMETWRCFVAVDLPDALRPDLAAAVTEWQREPDAPEVRWTDAAAWHVTLAFLGSLPVPEVDSAADALQSVAAAFGPMDVQIGGLGAFPSPRRARVLWYGIRDAEGALGALANAVRSRLEPTVPALQEESPFRPHLTLARAREPRGIDVSGWLACHRPPAGTMPVRGLRLYRSHLGGQRPARYELIREVGLMREASVHG